MMVQDFSSVVWVHGRESKRNAAHIVLQRLKRGVLGPVPRRAEFQPLGFPVSAVQYPEEVVGTDSPSEGERVHLYVARRDIARHDLLAGGGGNQIFYLVRCVPA